MRVNSIVSQSFGNKNLETRKQKNDNFYTWVSQNKIVDELRLSKGREIENGKNQFASGMLEAGSLLLFLGGLAQSAAVSTKKTKEGTGLALGLLTGALVTNVASKLIEAKNKIDANKTAKERGFKTIDEVKSAKTQEEKFEVIKEQYNAHTV